MKQTMQIVAMAAFLGCFAILVIAAGSHKAKQQENCSEEWKKPLQEKNKQPRSAQVEDKPFILLCKKPAVQDVILPIQRMHILL